MAYGATERVSAWLTEEFVRAGHHVTLFATGDSGTTARLKPTWPHALRLTQPQADPMAAQAVALEAFARHAGAFEVVHCHFDWLHLPVLTRSGYAVPDDAARQAGACRDCPH